MAGVDQERILKATLKDLYNGVPMEEVRKGVVLAARTLIEKDPAYSFVTARLLLDALRHEALGEEATQHDMATKYAEYFPQFVQHGTKIGLLNEALLQYDMKALGSALKPERDLQFGYLGLQTLYDRYFLVDQYVGGRRFELPQCFWHAGGDGTRARTRSDREARALRVLQRALDVRLRELDAHAVQRRHAPSAVVVVLPDYGCGRPRRHLRSHQATTPCSPSSPAASATTGPTSARIGSRIKGTNGESQGVVPFLKVVNDTAVAVNQGGKRQGAVCAYLESWHLDIEEFLELRKNTGDDRRRTHDMNTANWIPDLFMKRVIEGGDGRCSRRRTCPTCTTSRARVRGRYTRYERLAAKGELKLFKRVPARAALAEDADDAVRDRPPVDHVQGPVQRALAAGSRGRCPQLEPLHRDHAQHARDEIAVCNLGSINLLAHMTDRRKDSATSELDHTKLQQTAHRGADARQRHRHQLLRRAQGGATPT